MRATAAIVAGTALLALVGFGIGRLTAPSDSDAHEAHDNAKAEAASTTKRAAYAKGKARGLSEGKKKGREDGDSAGERKGLAAGQEAVANGTATGTTTDGTTTDSTGSGGSSGSSGGSSGSSGGSTSDTPSVDSPQGREIIQNSPECQQHPPPPDYHGPVQC